MPHLGTQKNDKGKEKDKIKPVHTLCTGKISDERCDIVLLC